MSGVSDFFQDQKAAGVPGPGASSNVILSDKDFDTIASDITGVSDTKDEASSKSTEAPTTSIPRPVLTAEDIKRLEAGPDRPGLILSRPVKDRSDDENEAVLTKVGYKPPEEVVERLLRDSIDKSRRRIASQVFVSKRDDRFRLMVAEKAFADFRTFAFAAKVGEAIEIDSTFIHFPSRHPVKVLFSKSAGMLRASCDFSKGNYDIREVEKAPGKFIVTAFKTWDWQGDSEYSLVWKDDKSWKCSCGSRSCDHIKCTREWHRLGQPLVAIDRIYYDEVYADRKKRFLKPAPVRLVKDPAEQIKKPELAEKSASYPIEFVTPEPSSNLNQTFDSGPMMRDRVSTEPNRNVKDEWMSIRETQKGGDDAYYILSEWQNKLPVRTFNVHLMNKDGSYKCSCGKTGCSHVLAVKSWLGEGSPSGKKYPFGGPIENRP